MNFHKKFSLAHLDNQRDNDNLFYNLYGNTADGFTNNIHDIYFGKFFRYPFKGSEKSWGNCMGVEASDTQIDNLFRLQEEKGIEIALTINSLNCRSEIIYNENIRNRFTEWLGQYYDRGLRSCTISSEHLMRQGDIKERCPDMRWKSTVNQICTDAQSLIDYATLGYNTILLDRSLNRNLNKLKTIKKAQDYYNAKNPDKKLLTSLLIHENCIFRCPFKREHDAVGEYISAGYFSSIAPITCQKWQSTNYKKLPRSGINIIASSKETFEKYAELVDVFKFSGRLSVIRNLKADDYKFAWVFSERKERDIYAESFEEIVENNLEPIHSWIPGWINIKNKPNDWHATWRKYDGIWSTDAGKSLEKRLLTCRNQCWDCHQCERTFGLSDIDSVLEI